MSEEANLVAMLEHSVRQHHARTALLDPRPDEGYDTWTYGDLWHDVQSVAGHLMQCGVSYRDRVGLLSDSRAWWPIADFAIMSTGACTVPIYPSLPANQATHIVQHARMKGIFVQNAAQLQKLLQASAATLTDLKFVIVFENDLSDAVWTQATSRFTLLRFSDLRTQPPASSEADWNARWQHLQRSDLATIVYTSGTTGLPKGAMLTHGNLLANIEGIRPLVPMQPTDRSLSYLPLSHIFERTAGQMVPLNSGGSIAYSRGFRYVAEDFKRIPPIILTTVPRLLEKVYEQVMLQMETAPNWKRTLFNRALDYGMKARVHKQRHARWLLRAYDKLVFEKIRHATGGQLRVIVVGGAPMPRYAGEFFTAAGFTVVEGYGMTETSPVISVNPSDSPRLGTAGKILFNVEAKIADDRELLVRGPSVMYGYYLDPEATAAAFTSDGWLHTGDIGEISEDGFLRITDRKKNLLVLSTGKKVTPAPIEAEILKTPYIDQVLLIGQGRKYVSAIAVANEEMVRKWWASSGREDQLPPNWREDDALRTFFLAQMVRCTLDFARFEQPKQLLFAREPFTVENGLLTPTLKVRAKSVQALYAAEIDDLYARGEAEMLVGGVSPTS